MSEFSKGVMNVLGDECPGDECRTIPKKKVSNTKIPRLLVNRIMPPKCTYIPHLKINVWPFKSGFSATWSPPNVCTFTWFVESTHMGRKGPRAKAKTVLKSVVIW